MDIETIARHAYNAYGDAVGGTTHDGRPMPGYDELGGRQKAGWEAATAVAYRAGYSDGQDRTTPAPWGE